MQRTEGGLSGSFSKQPEQRTMKAAVGFVCSCTAVYYLQLCANSRKPFFSPSNQALASSAFDCTQELPPAARQPGSGHGVRSDHSDENPQEPISRAQLSVCVCKKQERATKCTWENLRGALRVWLFACHCTGYTNDHREPSEWRAADV